jgi:peptidyl-prolyl cis-trans isomerase B (cyclophilin B)
MKHLHGLLLAITVGMLPATAFTQENNSQTKGTGMVTVNMETSAGTIKLELDAGKAPDSVENFVTYAKAGHYDGTIFHRVIPGFMIQGGGFDIDMKQKSTNAPIKNEADNGLKNADGTIAMARTNDPHSATSQFFINVKDNDFLDHRSPSPQGWGYTVFGKVVDGMDVVRDIEKVSTGSRNGHGDVPVENVVITKVTVED